MSGSLSGTILRALALLLGLAICSSASGQVIVTQAKAVAGGVTAGDAKGFPIDISTPGSYRLGSNLTPATGQDGIYIRAPDVTIDLNGFRISGGPAGGANNGHYGIYVLGDRATIRNGTIGAFKTTGIQGSGKAYLIVEDMRIVNGGYGLINSEGSFTRVQNSTIATNTAIGIVCGLSCHVEGSIVSGNLWGISIQSGTVLGNTIFSNTYEGIQAGGAGASITVGFGNNTIMNNNGGGAQISAHLKALHPNVCVPVAC